jgi:ParB family transcriptional regulator, chromosome partitioning protein
LLRNGLGRGLGALIPPEAARATKALLQEVPLALIKPNQRQPRTQFDEEALSSLVDSIRAVGVLQPVLLRQDGEEEYELIAGERRCRAARRAGLQTIPALVQTMDDAASLERAVVENIQREDLNPLDEAGAYQQLIEDFSLTHEEVAQRVGRSRAAVTNALRLFQLPTSVQRCIRDGALTAGHARALLMTPDRELQEDLAAQAQREGLSVRALEEIVRMQVRLEHEVETADELEDSPEPDEPAAVPARHVNPLRPPGVLELEQLLATHLNTRVRVDMSDRHGRVVIDFADLADLERIYRSMLSELST